MLPPFDPNERGWFLRTWPRVRAHLRQAAARLARDELAVELAVLARGRADPDAPARLTALLDRLTALERPDLPAAGAGPADLLTAYKEQVGDPDDPEVRRRWDAEAAAERARKAAQRAAEAAAQTELDDALTRRDRRR